MTRTSPPMKSVTDLTNLLDLIRTRRGLKWGVPGMLLSLPYLYVASFLTVLIEDGAPGWLHVLVVLCL